MLERAAAFGLRIGFLGLENGWFYNGRRRLSLQVARVLSPAFDCECALGFMCSLRAPDLHVQSGQPERTAASGLRVGNLGLVLGLETGVVWCCPRHGMAPVHVTHGVRESLLNPMDRPETAYEFSMF